MVERRTAGERFDCEAFQHQLNTRFFGREAHLLYRPVVDSTNALALQLACEGSAEGVVVVTDSQVAGRGRLGRRWVDLAGHNVLSSTIVRPLFPTYLLVMLASLAVVDAIAATCDLRALLKWPNDVLLAERKVAGILIETAHDLQGRLVAILGIGVNVNGRGEAYTLKSGSGTLRPAEPVSGATYTSPVLPATTLESECGYQVSRERFLARMLERIEDLYLALQEEARQRSEAPGAPPSASRLIRERWRTSLSTLGRAVEVDQGGTRVSGIAEDVDERGELLLRLHSGKLVSITWGDVGHSAR